MFREYYLDNRWHRQGNLQIAYFHLDLDCLRRVCPNTELPDDIHVPDDFGEKGQPSHSVKLINDFLYG